MTRSRRVAKLLTLPLQKSVERRSESSTNREFCCSLLRLFFKAAISASAKGRCVAVAITELTDLDNLRERLNYIAAGGAGKIVPVLGSGMSNGSVPGTAAMTDLFLAELNENMRQGLASRWSGGTPPYERYQNSAEAVGRQRGDKALTRIIRRAVLSARIDDTEAAAELSSSELRQITRDDRWKLTAAHQGFAEFYSRIPPDVRGPIITTNFDPLIEVALRAHGVTADPVPVTFDDPPNLSTIANMSTTPVIHMHGYFAEDWSVNSLSQLRASRIQLESLLSTIFSGATVLVIGYGGWEDAFMRVLELHARQQTLLNAEIIWCAHSPNVRETLSNPILGRLSEGPGFQLYSDIDGATLFDSPVGVRVAPPSLSVPRGWTPLPVHLDRLRDPEEFSAGASPSWSDALPGRWPLLSGARELLDEVSEAMARDTSEALGVAAIGPLGEGKSMASRQVAMHVAEQENDWTVLWRESSAPPLTADWLQEERGQLGNVLFCVDEADLAGADLHLLRSYSGPGRTVLLMATQDRLWWSMAASLRSKVSTVIFDGLVERDAEDLAARWRDLGTLPRKTTALGSRAEAGVDEVAKALRDVSADTRGSSRSTLFGAILSVREASSLRERVGDLMARLTRTPVRSDSSLSLADVYGLICAMQFFVDPENSGSKGATRNLISALVNGEESMVNVAVLDALGREANITFAGRHVFARHPLIAEAVVTWLSGQGRLGAVCELGAEAGARMKIDGADYLDYADAYLLARSIQSARTSIPSQSSDIALKAALGAIRGAQNLLEPRINYLSIARKADPELAYRYAHAVVLKMSEMSDFRSNSRVFLNELALIELAQNQPLRALGVAGLILHNGTGFAPDRKKMEYGLATMARCYGLLVKRNPTVYSEGAELVASLSQQLMETKDFLAFVSPVLSKATVAASEIRKLPVGVELDKLARIVTEISFSSVKELRLPFQTDGRSVVGRFPLFGRLDYSDLKVFSSRT